MSELDFSKVVGAPQGAPERAAPVLASATVGAGAYRTATIHLGMMPLPRPPWWVRLQAFVFLKIVGREVAHARQWYRRARGGRWAQMLDSDGDPTWHPVQRCPARYNAHVHPPGAPPGVCYDDLLMMDWEVLGAAMPPICHCEVWP